LNKFHSRNSADFCIWYQQNERRLGLNLKLSANRNRKSGCISGNQFSRRIAVIVLEDPAELFTALDVAANLANFVTRFNDFVAKPLMIPLSMIMFEERGDFSPKKIILESASDLRLLMNLSKWAFKLGLRGGSNSGSAPSSRRILRNAGQNFVSRSINT
jgi:hypothetical protein